MASLLAEGFRLRRHRQGCCRPRHLDGRRCDGPPRRSGLIFPSSGQLRRSLDTLPPAQAPAYPGVPSASSGAAMIGAAQANVGPWPTASGTPPDRVRQALLNRSAAASGGRVAVSGRWASASRKLVSDACVSRGHGPWPKAWRSNGHDPHWPRFPGSTQRLCGVGRNRLPGPWGFALFRPIRLCYREALLGPAAPGGRSPMRAWRNW